MQNIQPYTKLKFVYNNLNSTGLLLGFHLMFVISVFHFPAGPRCEPLSSKELRKRMKLPESI